MMKEREREVFKRVKELAKLVSEVKKDAFIGTPTYVRLQKLWNNLDDYLVDYAEWHEKV